jgi:hydrogenase maturation protease
VSRRLVVGLGNRLRGDDAVGLDVALALDGTPGLEVVALEGEPVELIELWRGADAVVLVDAVAGGEPGRVRRLAGEEALGGWQAGAPASSHAMGLAQVLELAAALDRLPPRLEVWAIEGDSFATGNEPTAPVSAAGRRVAAAIAAASSVASTPIASAAPTDVGTVGED